MAQVGKAAGGRQTRSWRPPLARVSCRRPGGVRALAEQGSAAPHASAMRFCRMPVAGQEPGPGAVASQQSAVPQNATSRVEGKRGSKNVWGMRGGVWGKGVAGVHAVFVIPAARRGSAVPALARVVRFVYGAKIRNKAGRVSLSMKV